MPYELFGFAYFPYFDSVIESLLVKTITMRSAFSQTRLNHFYIVLIQSVKLIN